MTVYEQVWPQVFDCLRRTRATILFDEQTRIYGSSIGINRSELAGRFIDWRGPSGEIATHMMCLDSDVWWLEHEDLISRLLIADRDIVLCAYPTRKAPFDFCVVPLTKYHSLKDSPLTRTPAGPVMPIKFAGIGCCLIKRQVIEKLYTSAYVEHYHSWDNNAERRMLFRDSVLKHDGAYRAFGEDYGFEALAAQEGFDANCLVNATLVHACVAGSLEKRLI